MKRRSNFKKNMHFGVKIRFHDFSFLRIFLDYIAGLRMINDLPSFCTGFVKSHWLPTLHTTIRYLTISFESPCALDSETKMAQVSKNMLP